MINPIYKFEITSIYGQTVDNKTVYPIYKSDLAVDWQIEQNEQYYRGKLSGKLNFIGDDFDFIYSKNFETEFELRVFISYNAGASWTQYWMGKFYKTDCEFDVDDKKITVTPTVFDEYNDVVAGLEKEYNLIELAPEIQHIQLDKRPMIQVYSPGESVIACFLSGMYWEQECEAESDRLKLIELGDGKPNFAKSGSVRIVDIETDEPDMVDIFNGDIPNTPESPMNYTNGGYRLIYEFINSGEETECKWSIYRVSDNVELWSIIYINTPPPTAPYERILLPVSGSGAQHTVKIYVHDQYIYSRFVLDTEKIGDLDTYLLSENDIVGNNRNYHRCIAYEMIDTIYFSNRFSATPTKYGIYQPGKYYLPPALYWSPQLYPIARSTWGGLSTWFSFSALNWIVEAQGRKQYTLKDAYPLSSVISVLLGQIAPNVKHEPTTDYSQFLYRNYNPLSGDSFKLFITQKSNILAGDYDQPAQKAPATLKMITDMLRDCFRCYWFIDKAENGDLRFRIEHISWFLNGGSYSVTPDVGTDLTQMSVTRNGKKWAFATSKYEYDKSQMPERYQFGWMDDVTELFEGYPIDIQSKFVQPGNIEEINVANFTSDIDYMLLNPGACSEDGFALLGAISQGGQYKLPYSRYEIGNAEFVLQNAYMSFYYLQMFYLWDMPAEVIQSQNVFGPYVMGIKKQKTQQLQYPVYNDPNLYQLVKTNMGNGQIEKISINLSSRKAKTTLRYDTE